MCRMDEAEKEDIYQLGVILLEVITGKRITSANEIEELKDEVPIEPFLFQVRQFYINCYADNKICWFYTNIAKFKPHWP